MSREEMDSILDDGLQAAIHLLEKNGEFYPFAVAVDAAGGLRHVEGYTGDEHPLSDDLISFLHDALAQQAAQGEYRATGIVSNVTLTDRVTSAKGDAISVAIEHRDAEPVTCFLPYRLSDGQFIGEEVVAERGQSVVFNTMEGG